MEIVRRKADSVHHETRKRIIRAVEVGLRKPMAIAVREGLGYNDLIELFIEEKAAVRAEAYEEGFEAGRRGLFPVPPPPAKAA